MEPKVYITYFYNIRFFKDNMIPVSTAVWDPKWFHNNGSNTDIFVDDNDIYNGIRCSELSPYKITQWLRLPTSTAAAKSLQSCSTLCDPIDGSPPGSPVSGILQARTLEWVAISFSNALK